MISFLLLAATASASPAAPPVDARRLLGQAADCQAADPAAIEICARRKDQYRIDPSTLSSIRAREAPPPKPEAQADVADAAGKACVGPQACQGNVVPLVGMALTALKAAELEAKGEDWREALRSHADDYRLYEQAEQRRAEDRKPKIGFGIRN